MLSVIHRPLWSSSAFRFLSGNLTRQRPIQSKTQAFVPNGVGSPYNGTVSETFVTE